jgi:hypothetical protein
MFITSGWNPKQFSDKPGMFTLAELDQVLPGNPVDFRAGVVEFVAAVRPTLGDLFAVWGQPLSRRRLAGFRARGADEVKAWIGGRRWHGDVRAIPLGRHGQIVVELGGYVPPHRFFRFPRIP